MREYGLDTKLDDGNWKGLHKRLDPYSQSPFFTKEYYTSYHHDYDEVECFWAYQDESNFLFYPYLIKSVNALGYDLDDQYFDVSGAYGYNGPLGVAEDQKFLSEYNSRLAEHFQQKNVVTEFVRYCPITNNRKFTAILTNLTCSTTSI